MIPKIEIVTKIIEEYMWQNQVTEQLGHYSVACYMLAKGVND